MTAIRLGRYELVRKIAAGGMAEIFLARQWGEGGFFRDVVIKRFFKHLAEYPRQLRMFQDEGRLLGALAHPNIPQVYDLGNADGYWYIAMEFVDGWNVADVWRQGSKTSQPMPMQVALGIVMQASEALHHAHERSDRAKRPLRIVHRDVTPQNIMLTRDGVVKLMDFGVAQTTARKDTEAGTVRGTFSYMAPEQVRAKPLDKRADVFALGVILYELTTGARLFRGTDVQIMTQVVEQDVAPPSTRIEGYPPDLEEIVLQMLARDRSRRTPSTAHVAWKLEELAQHHGFLVGPRAVSRYLNQIIPAEVLKEEDLAMVDAERKAYEVSNEAEDDEPSADLDEDGMLEDLNLLSMPDAFASSAQSDGAWDDSTGPSPISLPPDLLMDEASDARITTPSDAPPPMSAARGRSVPHDPMAFVDLLVEEPQTSRPPPPARLPRGVVPLAARSDLDLDGPEDGERPVVLLGVPKKKTSTRPKGGPSSQDYVRELERRLASDDDET